MKTLERVLKNRLLNARKIAILGIGSEFRCDDAAGVLVAEQLAGDRLPGEFEVFIGASAPENLSGEIKRFKPTHLVIIDSADSGKKAGAISLIDTEEVKGISFSTHRLPIKIMSDYLIQSIGCQITILGIQPKKLDFGSDISKEVRKSTEKISAALKKILKINNGARHGLEAPGLLPQDKIND